MRTPFDPPENGLSRKGGTRSPSALISQRDVLLRVHKLIGGQRTPFDPPENGFVGGTGPARSAEAWSFFGAWELELGISARSAVWYTKMPNPGSSPVFGILFMSSKD
jgi:hypothetical protein